MVREYPPFGLPPNYQLSAKSDAFVARLDLTKSGAASLIYSTYVGGAGKEEGTAIALDAAGNSYVTGYTASPDFPLVQPAQAAHGGKNDASFVFGLQRDGAALAFSTFLGGNGPTSWATPIRPTSPRSTRSSRADPHRRRSSPALMPQPARPGPTQILHPSLTTGFICRR